MAQQVEYSSSNQEALSSNSTTFLFYLFLPGAGLYHDPPTYQIGFH
jgi:hypothetical protein